MRTIEVEQITQAIAKMCMDACYYLSEDVYDALVSAGFGRGSKCRCC
ncbi:MAG: hydro-lyase, Fe-S type, tartrate/fumarate subfamily, alpha subunit [Firmicutes bacterium]|nr:hydro-lyase, Fe-S type, tartrate/fumarate subfamily, alpha subunit [Bacillota bacterium]